jgi:signal transduction histidine kinase
VGAIGAFATGAWVQGVSGLAAVISGAALLQLVALSMLLAHLRRLAATRAERAEAAIRARDDFISLAAHELRTPVTVLWGTVQHMRRQIAKDAQGSDVLAANRSGRGGIRPAMVEPSTSERAQRSLEQIDQQARRLSGLINQLLDLSQLNSGKFRLERRVVDLALAVRDVVGQAQMVASQHPIYLRAPDTMPAMVDQLRLEQVLRNLLDNAVKYTPAGTPIEVSLEEHTGGSLYLAVRDHGVGLATEVRDRVFDRYYQADLPGINCGLGLGLSLCKELVALHGGTISAEAPPDGGLLIVVVIPDAVAMATGSQIDPSSATPLATQPVG